MTEQHEWRPFRHMIAWGLITLIAIVAIFTTTGLLFYYFPPAAPTGVVYPYYGFFGFRLFELFFGIFILFAAFWFLRFVFWGGWGWRYRRAYWGRYGYWRHHDSSYYILRERYARGEITKDQYDQMMRDLDQHETPT